jgi:spore maturation protein CgeB
MKKRIVQLESVYKSFFESFLEKTPSWFSYSYKQALETLFDSGWSSGQNVVPYMPASKWETFYIVPTLESLQKKWARQQIGSDDVSLAEILFLQLDAIKPDIVYLSDLNCVDIGFFSQLNKVPLVTGWCATEPNEAFNWRSLDLLLSGIGSIRQRTLDLGVRRAEKFMSGAPSFRNVNGGGFCGRKDLCFSGSFSRTLHHERAKNFAKLGEAIPEYRLDIYTESQPQVLLGQPNIRLLPAVYASDVVCTYSDYKIVLDGRADFGLGEAQYSRETSNMRIFEATKAGSMLLTEHCENLDEYFEIGVEIETYSSVDELREKCRYYLRDDNELKRENIARNGQLRTLSEHSIESRALWFEKIIENAFFD